MMVKSLTNLLMEGNGNAMLFPIVNVMLFPSQQLHVQS